MKKVLKKIFIAFLTIFVLTFILMKVDKIVSYKTSYGIRQYDGFYMQDKNLIDVLFVGSSHVYSDIDPAYIYDEEGILSYDLATGGASIWSMYYSILEALNYQKPKVIVLEIFGCIRGDYNLSSREIVDATFKIRNPIIKFNALKSLYNDRMDFVNLGLAFPWYHTLYKDVNKYDYSAYENSVDLGGNNIVYLYDNNNLKSYKGTTTLRTINPIDKNINNNISDTKEIGKKVKVYLDKIIKLAKENDIEICFLLSPFPNISVDQQMQVNYIIEEICDKNDYLFLNTNANFSSIPIDMSRDFGDNSDHLNYIGMEKYSRWLARELKNNFDLENKKGTKEAKSWDENLIWQSHIKDISNLKYINNFDEYIQNIKSEYVVFAIALDNAKTLLNDLSKKNKKSCDGMMLKNGYTLNFYNSEKNNIVYEYKTDTIEIKNVNNHNAIIYNGVEKIQAKSNEIAIVVYDEKVREIIDVARFNVNDKVAIR